MKFFETSRKTAGVLVVTAALVGTAAASGTAVATQDAAQQADDGTTATTAQAANRADKRFVRMMIPHHFQALVMSRMAPARAGDQDVRALASRIDVEQSGEITMMQSWQGWNGSGTTNPRRAYRRMMRRPAMIEMMGMATRDELASMRAASGTEFDRLYLELMIDHHEGAIRMLTDVIINGQDFLLEDWATGMLTTQYTQVQQMQAMLDDLE